MSAPMVLPGTLPPWVLMWILAVAIYAGCKWLTYRQAVVGVGPAALSRSLGYLVAWPGMDAAAFLFGTGRETPKPAPREWVSGFVSITFGVTLIWVIAPTALPAQPLLAGWLAMVGLIFILHFGTFRLLSVAWRSNGIEAPPVMRNPVRSTSLAEFWGRRWNTPFHELAARFTFRPMRRLVGAAGASLVVFLISGLVHELVISIPAGGGYGLPTGYFVLQGLGVAGERSRLGRWMGLGRGWRGWVFTALVTAGPAFCLFPPPFVHRIILPMLSVIGAS